jgi:hypothetical protein
MRPCWLDTGQHAKVPSESELAACALWDRYLGALTHTFTPHYLRKHRDYFALFSPRGKVALSSDYYSHH